MRVVIADAGFGGLELATRLAAGLGDGADVVLIDRAEGFVFGFSKLDVMFGRAPAEHVIHRCADVARPGISFVHVYAVGDVTSVGTPKAGVFAEGQAAVVAEQLLARHAGAGSRAGYDGRGTCDLEFGHDSVAKVEVTFQPGRAPTGGMEGPSPALVKDKKEFGADRVQRWF